MRIYHVFDTEFKPYGKVVSGYDTQSLVRVLREKTPLPESTTYVASSPELEQLSVARQLQDNAYGGMPIQLGFCNGHNTKLNALEYHRDSEFNLGAEDFILLLAKQEEIIDGEVDTARVKAFLCPADVLVEIYATTLHYAPCNAKKDIGFRVMVALPLGTNTARPETAPLDQEDARLWARNKWLLAHPDSDEAAQGAYVGLSGENLDIKNALN